MRIDIHFPGGNVEVLGALPDGTIILRPALRDTMTFWFWWAFRVRDAAGQTLRFKFADCSPVGVRGPALSRDRINWTWQEYDFEPDSFTVAVPKDAADFYCAFAPTYTAENFRRFIFERPTIFRKLHCSRIATSRRGRDVYMFSRAKQLQTPRRVIITARHHACESIASFVMEGMIDALYTLPLTDNAFASGFRNVRVDFIPFVDTDGVEDGDQGKNRAPHDHNRDYGGRSIWPEIAALRDYVAQFPRKTHLEAFIDLHCPCIRGKGSEEIFQYASSVPATAENQRRLAAAIAKYNTGDTLPFDPAGPFPGGDPTKKPAALDSLLWAEACRGNRLSSTFEIPYANASGTPVTAERARSFGKALAKALSEIL